MAGPSVPRLPQCSQFHPASPQYAACVQQAMAGSDSAEDAAREKYAMLQQAEFLREAERRGVVLPHPPTSGFRGQVPGMENYQPSELHTSRMANYMALGLGNYGTNFYQPARPPQNALSMQVGMLPRQNALSASMRANSAVSSPSAGGGKAASSAGSASSGKGSSSGGTK